MGLIHNLNKYRLNIFDYNGRKNWFGDSLNRRSVIKTTGVGISSTVGLASVGTGYAEEDTEGCVKCRRNVIDEQGTRQKVLIEQDGEYNLYKTDSEVGSVEYITTISANSANEAETEAKRVLEQSLVTHKHDEIFEDSDLWTKDIGDCDTVFYTDHKAAGLSVKAGDSLDEYPSGVLEGALCAVIGAKVANAPGAALGAIVCFSVSFFLSHINLSGAELTLAAYDGDTGYNQVPEIRTAAAGEMTEDLSNMIDGESIPGTHVADGYSVEDILADEF